MPPDILNNQITEEERRGQSVKGSLLDIDRILTEQIEENALSFWCACTKLKYCTVSYVSLSKIYHVGKQSLS